MSMNILNDISKVYLENVAESAVPGKPAEKLGAVTAIPKSEQEAARERLLAKAKAKREKMKEETEIDEALTGERYKKAVKKPGGTAYSRMVSADPAKRATRGGRGGESDFGAGDRGSGNKAARRAGTYQEEYVDEAVKGADPEMRKAASAERRSGDKRLAPSKGKGYADQQKQQIAYMDKVTKKNKNVVGLVTKEEAKPNDGNLANNYPPYDKVTRGDVIAGATGKDQMGGKKKKKVKEGFSNWRQDLSEVMDDIEANKQIKEKKVNNKIKINPEMKESFEEFGATLMEMVEIDEFDYIVESAYDELLEEGYEEDDIEEAIEYALTEAKVTFGHDTASTEKKKKSLLSTAREKLSGAKASAKAAVARGARKVAKGALGVARKMEGGDKAPKRTERKPSTYRGAGAGTKERVSSGSYTAPTKKKAEKPSDPWEGSATTPPKAKAKKAAPKATAKTTKVTSKKKKSNLDNLLASIRNEEVQLDEKALSKQQQKFMGMVYAVKKGEMKAPSPEVAKAAAGMSKKSARDFAKTKHKGLPQVKEDVLNEREHDEPGEGTRQKYGDMRGLDRGTGNEVKFGGKWQSKARKEAGAAALAKLKSGIREMEEPTMEPTKDKASEMQQKKIQVQKVRDLTTRLQAARKGVY